MAKNNVIEQGKPGNRPVTKELRRAGARIAYAPAVEEPEPEAELDRSDEELDFLREIVRAAAIAYTHDGIPFPTAADMVSETLKCARDDIELLAHCEMGDMPFVRTQYRIDLGMLIASYIEAFGYPRSSDERLVGAQLEAEQAGDQS